MGFPMTFRGCELGPLRFTMRPWMDPVIEDPSVFLATGTLTHSLFGMVVSGARAEALAGTAVAPALSLCQPLLRPTSPRFRSAATMVSRPPRLGTSCHKNPLAWLMSFGFTRKKLVT